MTDIQPTGQPLDLDAIRGELTAIADLAVAAEGAVGALVNQRFTTAWANVGRHVPALLAEVEHLRDADGLARDALRRSGYHFSADAGKPLAELIEKLNADARNVVRACGGESKRLRDRLDAVGALDGDA